MFENNEENRNSSYHCYKHPRSQCLQQRRQRSHRKNRRRRCNKRRALHKHEENSWCKRPDTAGARKVLDKKYKVTDKEIDNKLKEYKTQLGDQYTALEEQYGKDYLKEQVKYELLTQKAAKDNIKVTDADTKEYWEGLKDKIRASHILVADKKTAEEVEKKLKKGEKFEDLAKEYSTDNSASQGGDLGWFAKDGMVAEFSKAAFKLKTGEVSDPVKTQYGYHIIKKTEERGKYDDMKKELKSEVLEQKLNDTTAVQEAVQKVMKKADVEVKDKDLKDTFNTSSTSSSSK